MGRRYHPMRELLLDRLRLWHREPEVLFWVYLFPLLLIVGLGIAFTGDGDKPSRVRVVSSDPQLAQTTAMLLDADEAVEAATATQNDLATASGSWDLTLRIEPGHAKYILDPQQPESRLARERVDRLLQSNAGRRDPILTEVVERSVPGSRYVDWVIPGLLGLNILGSSMWGVGFTVVDLRLRKVLKRLSATPMRHWHFLAALLGARMLFLGAEVIAILAFGHFIFDMPIVGDALSIAAFCALGAAAFSAVSLALGSRAQKLETVSGLMNVVQVPMWLLSGVFFSSDRFPAFLQPFIQLLPLTQLNNGLRAVILEGRNIFEEGPAAAILAAWAAASFVLALKLFRWR